MLYIPKLNSCAFYINLSPILNLYTYCRCRPKNSKNIFKKYLNYGKHNKKLKTTVFYLIFFDQPMISLIYILELSNILINVN